MRIDVYLCEKGYAKSRTLAQRLIDEGNVHINGTICTKNSTKLEETDIVDVKTENAECMKYVGRGGLKLEGAVVFFNLRLDGCKCLDIGASTGGFTDCMLKNGAVSVTAVDVGTNQLDERLRTDKRVTSYEKLDIRNADMLPDGSFDFIGTDVSFISLKMIIPVMKRLSMRGGICVALIKPQFEAGKKHLNKNGIVHNTKIQENIVSDIREFAELSGFEVIGTTESPIVGGDGNREFLICMRNG